MGRYSLITHMKILDKQLDALPREVVFCKKCVVSNQRPRIVFDENGVCSACNYAEYKENKIDWDAREQELVELLNKHRSKDGSFDIIVPGSGGKDSGYVAHVLKEKYGMHPLCVTWAPFIYTDIGWKNFNNFVQSGFNVLSCYQDGVLHRKLARTAFEVKGDAWEPFTYGQNSYAFHIALKFDIKLIFLGENGEAEYGGSMKDALKSYESIDDCDHFHYKGAGVETVLEAGRELGILTAEEANPNRFLFYQPPKYEELANAGIQTHWMSYYKKWVPQENFYYASKNTGFEVNPDGRSEGTHSKYASLDDKTDGFHWYLGYIKFGMGRATRDAMMEIRSGHIDRDEAIALVKRYDGEFPSVYFQDFIKYLDISEERFWEVVDAYRLPHLWEKKDGMWKLKQVVS